MENLLSSCRLCLTNFNDGQSIIDLFEGNNTNGSYSVVAMELTNLKITKDDMYPKHICESCTSQLAIFEAFRTSCQLSFKKLQVIVPLGMSIRDSRKLKLAAEFIFESDGNNEMPVVESEGSFHDDEMLVQLCDYEPYDIDENSTADTNETNENNLIELTIKTERDLDEFTCEPVQIAEIGKLYNIENAAIKMELKPKRKRAAKLPASERNLHCAAYFSRHQMSHAGIKEFSCELCEQQFTRRSHLNSHMMIHNQIKPFRCEVQYIYIC